MEYIKKYTGVVLLIFLILFKIQESNFVMKVENILYDAYQTIFIEKSDYNDVVIVDIDEKSIGEIGQFPWRRDVFANLIDRLNQYGVLVIAFDIFFSEDDKQNPKKILEEFNIDNNTVLDSDQETLKEIKDQYSHQTVPLILIQEEGEEEKLLGGFSDLEKSFNA